MSANNNIHTQITKVLVTLSPFLLRNIEVFEPRVRKKQHKVTLFFELDYIFIDLSMVKPCVARTVFALKIIQHTELRFAGVDNTNLEPFNIFNQWLIGLAFRQSSPDRIKTSSLCCIPRCNQPIRTIIKHMVVCQQYQIEALLFEPFKGTPLLTVVWATFGPGSTMPFDRRFEIADCVICRLNHLLQLG